MDLESIHETEIDSQAPVQVHMVRNLLNLAPIF